MSASGAGYGKPPKSSQFKKGQSGNPDGRPKQVVLPIGNQSAAALTLREAKRVIPVRDGDGVHQMTQIEAILRAQYVSASKGNAYSQKHILERYERAEREQRLARHANNERWHHYVLKGRQAYKLAEKNGEEPPELLPHPDDVEIDPDRGVIFHGPYDPESLEQTQTHCALRDVLLLQDAFDVREGLGDRDYAPTTTALYCALELNRSLAARFRLADQTIAMRLMLYASIPKRELARTLRAAWRPLGYDRPAHRFLPPLESFIEGYSELLHHFYELAGDAST